MGNNGFLTAKEVAEEFFEGRVCYKQILAMTRSGELPARKIGKNYIYRWSALEDWAKMELRKPAWTSRKK